MNKLILVAVAGLCFGNIYAKNPKKDKAEEGFVHKEPEPFKHMLVILQPWIPGIRIAP